MTPISHTHTNSSCTPIFIEGIRKQLLMPQVTYETAESWSGSHDGSDADVKYTHVWGLRL